VIYCCEAAVFAMVMFLRIFSLFTLMLFFVDDDLLLVRVINNAQGREK
jgi:hypothetical protein